MDLSTSRFFVAALALLLLVVAPVHPASGSSARPNLSGTWIDAGEEVVITDDGSTVTATYTHQKECAYDGTVTSYKSGFTVTGSGLELTGTGTICYWGETDPEKPAPKGVHHDSPVTIVVSAEGLTLQGEQVGHFGLVSFSLRRDCDEDAIKKTIREQCLDLEKEHQRMAAAFNHATEATAAYQRAVDRFFGIKTMTLGTAKTVGKLAVIKKLPSQAARTAATKVFLIGGILVTLSELGHVKIDFEDRRFHQEGARVIYEELADSNARCLGALAALEACAEEHEERYQAEAERRRRMVEEADLRERAMLLQNANNVYRDAEGHVYAGTDALRAAMRDLEQGTVPPGSSLHPWPVPSDGGVVATSGPATGGAAQEAGTTAMEVLYRMVREALTQALGAVPTEPEVRTTALELIEAEKEGSAGADASNPIVHHMLRAHQAARTAEELIRSVAEPDWAWPQTQTAEAAETGRSADRNGRKGQCDAVALLLLPEPCPRLYRPRQPRASPLFRLVDAV